ncbi:MAG: hypothetical protein RLZZ450_5031 [Pseudomonadota bacterium]|jgi:serine/threonine-protein kinase
MLLPPIGSLIAEKYRLESLLGEGGMGAVFRARHELMDKPVAVKWLKPTSGDEAAARHRFMQEARAAARIRHPNVVDVYDVGEQDHCLFMVMELLEGETFADYLEQTGMSVAEALRHLLGAMRGVAAAHAAGITHRDIKPENVFIAVDPLHVQGVAKILDFGISKLHDEPQPNLTLAGTTMGTPHYMSYEQIRCMSDVDHRTDIYAFGVLLYQAITGALPYDSDTLPGIIMQAATGRAVRPIALCPELPPELDELVMKAIALRREDRFQSIDAMISALTRIQLARHSWSSSTERPSWVPSPSSLLSPALRPRTGSPRPFSFARAPAGTLRPTDTTQPHTVDAEAGLPKRALAGKLSQLARLKFAPINPWLGLAGAALGVVMGGTLYTRVMTPTPAHAGKASASAPMQSASLFDKASVSTAAPTSAAGLLVTTNSPGSLAEAPGTIVGEAGGSLVPSRLPSGKEPPLSLSTTAGLGVDSSKPDMRAMAPRASATLDSVHDKSAQRVSQTASPGAGEPHDKRPAPGVRTQAAGSAAVAAKPAPGLSTSPAGTASAALEAAPSPFVHTHRSGPLKLEDL